MSDYMDSLYENLNEESLAAITAGAGYNDGANNGFWRIQPRLPKFREGAGQWMEMGAEIRAAFKKLGQIMSRAGKVVGSGGTSDTVRVLHPAEPERGLPEEIKIYPTTAVELIGARLSPEYLRSIGRDPNATGTGISAMSNPDNLPNYEDLPTAPVTDDDRRLAELGTASPEGQEMSKYKDSPEGQEIARLEPESADDVLDTPAEIANLLSGKKKTGLFSKLSEMFSKFSGNKAKTGRVELRRYGKIDRGIILTKRNEYDDYPSRTWDSFTTGEYVDADGNIQSISMRRDGVTGTLTVTSDNSKLTVKELPDGSYEVTADAYANGEEGKNPVTQKFKDLDSAMVAVNDTLKDTLGLSDDFTVDKLMYEGSKALRKYNDNPRVKNPKTTMDFPRSEEFNSEMAPAETPSVPIDTTNLPDLTDFNPNEKDYSTPTADMSPDEIAAGYGINIDPTTPNTWHTEYTDTEFDQGHEFDITYDPETGKYEVIETLHTGTSDRSGQRGDTSNRLYGTYDSPLEAFRDAQLHEWDEASVEDNLDMNNWLREKQAKKDADKKNAAQPMPDDRIAQIADDLVKRAMEGKNVDLDAELNKGPDSDDETDDEEEDTGDEEPTLDDLLDIEAEEEAGFDEDADWNDQRKSTERVSADEINPGDFIIDPDGDVARVEDIEVLPDGSINFTTVNYDGGPESAFNKAPEGSLSRVEFGASDAADDVTPEVPSSTPDVTPDDDEEEFQPTPAPPTARVYDPSEIEPGDEVYKNDGSDLLGIVISVRQNPNPGPDKGKWEAKLADPETGKGMFGMYPLDDKTLVNKPNGEKTPEVPEEPEVPVNRFVDEETANAAGFTRSSRDMLRGMKATRDDPMRQAYGKALANGRTSVIAQDIDGSWHLEKHDEFNGGIKETKRFETLQDALDEGNAFLENRDPKFDDVSEPEPEFPEAPDEVEEPEVPEVPDIPEVSEQDAEDAAQDRVDRGNEISLDNAKTEEELRNKKVAPLRDENGKRVKAVNIDTGEEKSEFAEDPDAIQVAILEEYPNAVIDPNNGAIIIGREKFYDPDGAEYELESRITRTNGANYMVSFKITNPDGEVVEYFSQDYRDSFSSIHGVTNGIQRLRNVLLGNYDEANWKMKNRSNAEWRNYFATGRIEDRLKYFRDKRNSKVTREKLEEALAKAIASENKYDIDSAQYALDLLDKEFGGDIEKYRAYDTTQNITFLTIDETIDRYASGRFYVVNKSKGRSYGTIVRSAVNGIFGSIADRDVVGTAQVLQELLGRLPDITKDSKIINQVLKKLEDGAKLRFPKENKNTLKAFIRSGSKHFEESGLDLGAFDAAPHVGWDGRILAKEMLVEYTNNNNETSVGVIDSLVPSTKNPKRPNLYNDYVLVRFRNQDGSIGDPVEVSAKNVRVLDESGLSPQALKKMTIYTPNLKGEDRLRARFGDAFLIRERAKESANSLFGRISEVGDGVRLPIVDADYYSNDNARPGRYLYDASGLPLGMIAAVRDLKSDSGEDGYSVAYVTPDNRLQFIGLKSKQNRAPKEGLSTDDGRGTNESDAGFTPNPADFADVGLDASSISSEEIDAESTLVDSIKGSPILGDTGSARVVGKFLALKKARAEYKADPSDANKKAYKDALDSYYRDLSHMQAVSSQIYNRPFTPVQVPGDDILTPDEVADLNATIRATVMERAKRDANRDEATPLSYDDLVKAASAPENAYSGYLPSGWSPQDTAAALDFEKAKHIEVTKRIADALGYDDTNNISDELAEAIAEGILRHRNSDVKDGSYRAPAWDVMSNESGDVIRVNRNGEPGSKNGYIASDAEIDAVVGVFAKLREQLNIGDKPLDFALTSERGVGGALGFVWTADMWADNAYQARAHLLVDTLPKSKERLKSKTEKFVEGKSWWSVDLSGDPERLAEYVAAHEMGHVMQGEALRQFGQTLSQDTWNKFYGPVATSHQVSEYGKTNFNEHFAESFVKWVMTGKANPKFLKFLADTGLLKSK